MGHQGVLSLGRPISWPRPAPRNPLGPLAHSSLPASRPAAVHPEVSLSLPALCLSSFTFPDCDPTSFVGGPV